MTHSTRSSPWALVALLLGLFLAYELGAGTSASLATSTGGVPVSFQVDVTDPTGQDVFPVPGDMMFILKDLLVANTQGNNVKNLKVSDDIYPTLVNGLGTTKIAGTNLQDWGTGITESKFGGGRRGGRRLSQTGLVGLTGGVVFEPNSSVVVRNYEGPLYFDGVLLPIAGM